MTSQSGRHMNDGGNEHHRQLMCREDLHKVLTQFGVTNVMLYEAIANGDAYNLEKSRESLTESIQGMGDIFGEGITHIMTPIENLLVEEQKLIARSGSISSNDIHVIEGIIQNMRNYLLYFCYAVYCHNKDKIRDNKYVFNITNGFYALIEWILHLVKIMASRKPDENGKVWSVSDVLMETSSKCQEFANYVNSQCFDPLPTSEPCPPHFIEGTYHKEMEKSDLTSFTNLRQLNDQRMYGDFSMVNNQSDFGLKNSQQQQQVSLDNRKNNRNTGNTQKVSPYAKGDDVVNSSQQTNKSSNSFNNTNTNSINTNTIRTRNSPNPPNSFGNTIRTRNSPNPPNSFGNTNINTRNSTNASNSFSGNSGISPNASITNKNIPTTRTIRNSSSSSTGNINPVSTSTSGNSGNPSVIDIINSIQSSKSTGAHLSSGISLEVSSRNIDNHSWMNNVRNSESCCGCPCEKISFHRERELCDCHHSPEVKKTIFGGCFVMCEMIQWYQTGDKLEFFSNEGSGCEKSKKKNTQTITSSHIGKWVLRECKKEWVGVSIQQLEGKTQRKQKLTFDKELSTHGILQLTWIVSEKSHIQCPSKKKTCKILVDYCELAKKRRVSYIAENGEVYFVLKMCKNGCEFYVEEIIPIMKQKIICHDVTHEDRTLSSEDNLMKGLSHHSIQKPLSPYKRSNIHVLGDYVLFMDAESLPKNFLINNGRSKKSIYRSRDESVPLLRIPSDSDGRFILMKKPNCQGRFKKLSINQRMMLLKEMLRNNIRDHDHEYFSTKTFRGQLDTEKKLDKDSHSNYYCGEAGNELKKALKFHFKPSSDDNYSRNIDYMVIS